MDQDDLSKTPIPPDQDRLKEIALIIQQQLKMELFGIDVIIDCQSGKYAVIDINAFPGKYIQLFISEEYDVEYYKYFRLIEV